jgi:hypothetical protein
VDTPVLTPEVEKFLEEEEEEVLLDMEEQPTSLDALGPQPRETITRLFPEIDATEEPVYYDVLNRCRAESYSSDDDEDMSEAGEVLPAEDTAQTPGATTPEGQQELRRPLPEGAPELDPASSSPSIDVSIVSPSPAPSDSEERGRNEEGPLQGLGAEPAAAQGVEPAAPAPPPSERERPGDLTERGLRYWIRCQRREDMEKSDQEQLAREIRQGEQFTPQHRCLPTQENGTLPEHPNRFAALSGEPTEVDITGYTGRGDTSTDRPSSSQGVTVERAGEADNREHCDPLATVCTVQYNWIQAGMKRVSPKRSRSPSEGLHKVRFDETANEVMTYEPEQTGSRPWERSVRVGGKWPLKPAVKVEREQERGGLQVASAVVAPEWMAPWVLEEVGTESGTTVEGAQAPGEEVVGMEVDTEFRERYWGRGREEAFQQRLLNMEASPRVYSTVDVEGFKFQVPKNLREAKLSSQADQWMQACNEELTSFDIHDTYEVVDRPENVGVLPTHWIFTPKVDGDGVIYRFKARLVVNGDRQIFGVDVNETFAPTATAAARRSLLSVAAAHNLEVHQADIKTAFLHGELDEEVFVIQPPGFGNGDPNKVWRLKKSVYGLKQAPRCWWAKLTEVLEGLGYVPTASDPSIYVNQSDPEDPMYLGVFVDDLAIVGKHKDKVMKFKEEIMKIFEIHDLGEIKDFLGASIVRDRENKVLYMKNTAKIDEYVEKFGLGGETKPVKVPLSPSFVVTKEPFTEVPATEFEVKRVYGSGTLLPKGHFYGELIGSLLYIANSTRPDISTAASVLSQFREKPTTAHLNEALRVLRYLKDTRQHALRLGGGGPVMEVFTDADYAGCLDTRRSRSGFLVKVLGGVVSWASKKQKTIAQSTVEAEFQAACLAINEVNWLRKMLNELGVHVGEVVMHCDNRGCLTHLKNPVVSGYTKHLAIRFHKTREAVVLGQVVPKYVGTNENTADIFTKALPPQTFLYHRDALGVVPVPSSLLKGKC